MPRPARPAWSSSTSTNSRSTLTATRLIPEALARRHRVLAIGYRGDTPIIGMANPSDVFAVDDLRTLLGRDLHIVVCSAGQIAEYLSRVYRHDRETTLAAQTAASQTSAGDETKITELTDLHAVVEDAPIVKYVNLILRQALQERASDIHIEPTADDLRIRFRIDGVLHEVTRSPKAIQGGVTTRLKVMASLDIAEHRVPQDGRITLSAGRREIDLRVATLPTVHGEKVVLRVLDKSSASLNLAELGFLPSVDKRYEVAYRKAVRHDSRHRPDRIGKVDDPLRDLERPQLARAQPHHRRGPGRVPAPWRQPGAGQPEGGLQLRERPALHPALRPRRRPRRRDPRPRDRRHRDRSRPHRSPRSLEPSHQRRRRHAHAARGDGGRSRSSWARRSTASLAQRLTRQLCENCHEEYSPTVEELELIGFTDADEPPNGKLRFRRAVGCQACSRTGYRGRIALQELLLVDEEIERAIIAHSSNDEIQRSSARTGDGSIASRRTAQSRARDHEPRGNNAGGRMSTARRSPTEWSRRLAEALVGAGRIPGDTAVAVLSEAASSGRPVAAVLADRGLVEPAVSLAELARISGSPLGRHLSDPARWARRSASCPSCLPAS